MRDALGKAKASARVEAGVCGSDAELTRSVKTTRDGRRIRKVEVEDEAEEKEKREMNGELSRASLDACKAAGCILVCRRLGD